MLPGSSCSRRKWARALAEILARLDDRFALSASFQALGIALDAGLQVWFRIGLRVNAVVAARRGRIPDAAVLVGGSENNLPPYGLDPAICGSVEPDCRAALGDAEFHRLAARGEAMTREQLVELCVERPCARQG